MTLYEKRGKRYIPVAEDRIWNSFPEGYHVVCCFPGKTITRFQLVPEKAGLVAAFEEHRDALAGIALEKVHSKGRYSVEDVIDAVLQGMIGQFREEGK